MPLGSILNDMIYEFFNRENADNLYIEINSRDISKLYANKKEFFYDTVGRLKTNKINVIQNNAIELGNVLLKADKKCSEMSIGEYTRKKYKEGYFNLI